MATHAKTTIGKWQTVLLATAVLGLAAALLALAGISSFDNLRDLAVRHHVPVAKLSPLELDGGLVVITLADIALTLAGYPIGGLRLVARLLGAGTVAANIAAGWPDPVGAFLRAFAPAIIVALTEAVRAFLLRRQHGGTSAVPAARWLLAFRSTFRLWRRMKLWGISDYAEAVDMELSRLVAVERLAMKYGPAWKDEAPADVVCMLARGVRMDDALRRVADLTGPGSVPEPAAEPVPVPPVPGRMQDGAKGRKHTRNQAQRKRNQKPEPAVPETVDADAEMRILAALQSGEIDVEKGILQLVANGRPASQAGKLAGRSDGYGRLVVRRARELERAAPRDVVDGQPGGPT